MATIGLYGGAISSALLLSVGHAFSSIGLFVITGGVIYDRYHTRLLRHIGGLLYIIPIASLAL
jgi:NADH-ubiquinone oxidoreductase chain 4